MNVMKEAVVDAFKKYVDFSGRATRPQFWWYVLAMFLVFLVLEIVAGVMFKVAAPVGQIVALIALLVALANLIPNIAIGVRRLHDAGFSGWLYLIVLIPFIGGIALLILFCLPTKS